MFISHEKTDQGLALEIRTHLETGGFDCWMAPDDIRGPTPWPEQVEAAIETCDVMLVVVSANSSGSQHMSREVDLAVERAKPLLPVRVEDVAPTGTLNYLLRLSQWIDLFPGSVADHAGTLQSMVGSILQEQDVRPPTASPIAKPKPGSTKIRRNAVVALAAIALIAAGIGIGTLLGGNDDQSNQVLDEQTTSASDITQAPASDITQAPASDDTASDATSDSVPEEATTTAAPAGKGTITRVSVTSDGTQGNDHSLNPVISADGRYVAFDSLATNLVEGDNNEVRDVFVHDRQTGETTRISQVVFGDRVEEASAPSSNPRISADGRYVVFASGEPNLDVGFEQTSPGDIYLHDRDTGRNRYISLMPDGSEHPSESIDPSMSDDATLIAYATYPTGQLPPSGVAAVQGEDGRTPVYAVWVHDTTTGATTLLAEFDMARDGASVSPPSVTPDGSVVVASELHSGTFIFERETGGITRLPEIPSTEALIPFPDGARFAFRSLESRLVPDDLNAFEDVFVYDRSTGEFDMLLDLGPDRWTSPNSISSDGRYVSMAAIPGVSLVLDTQDGTTTELSASLGLDRLELSADGRWATFSTSSNLDGDSNGKRDVFVIQLLD